MPHRPPEQPPTAPFLRSIHIQLDAEDGSRIQHFHPTAKSIPLLRSILAESEERAVFVVAPYGSGKSLTAAYALHLIENRRESREGLRSIGRRLQSVSPDLAEFGQRRMRSKTARGIVLALHGRVDSLGEGLKDAALQSFSRLRLGREARPLRAIPVGTAKQTLKFLYALTEKCRQVKMDRVCILWDEFGRHLEALLASGRASDLGDIQSLAEFTSRSDSPPMSLALLLHRGLLQYADNLPHSARLEWAKIEGRFKTIQYVDDSKEIYRLIRDVVTARRDGLEPAVAGVLGGVSRMSASRAICSARRRARSDNPPSACDCKRQTIRLMRNSLLPERVGSPNTSAYRTLSSLGIIRRRAVIWREMSSVMAILPVEASPGRQPHGHHVRSDRR